MSIASWSRQLSTVVRLNLRSMPRRLRLNATAILGFAAVVLVMTGVLSMQQGLSTSFLNSGREDVAIVLDRDADVETDSSFTAEQVGVISNLPGIARPSGTPSVSKEYLATLHIEHGQKSVASSIKARGMDVAGLTLHAPIEIVQGRQFQPGLQELLVGKQALSMNPELALGNKVKLGNREWSIVGEFTAGGAVVESEVWTSTSALQDAFGDAGVYNAVYVKLDAGSNSATLTQALSSEVRVPAKVLTEAAYLSAQSKPILTFINVLGTLIALLMGIGATMAAIITMYTVIAARTKELATMRCLGFGRSVLVIGLAVEAMVLGLVGGVIGSVTAYTMFNGLQAHTLVGSQVAFNFIVGWNLVLLGCFYTILLGLLGGLAPSFRAARVHLATAIRE